jgi:hypothetical protein
LADSTVGGDETIMGHFQLQWNKHALSISIIRVWRTDFIIIIHT